MKKGYLYLIFLSLFTLVVLGIALIYKLVPSKGNINITASANEPNIVDIRSLADMQDYKDSWIQKISKTDKQKEYIYPNQKFYIEFN